MFVCGCAVGDLHWFTCELFVVIVVFIVVVDWLLLCCLYVWVSCFVGFNLLFGLLLCCLV